MSILGLRDFEHNNLHVVWPSIVLAAFSYLPNVSFFCFTRIVITV